MPIITHHLDVVGSVVVPNNDPRKTRAVRKGFVRAAPTTGNYTKKEVVDLVVTALHGTSVPVHPSYSLITLQTIRLNQVGNQWYEYEADYFWKGPTPDRVRMSASAVVLDLPWPDEASSGLQWTPNSPPPPMTSILVPVVRIAKTYTYSAVSTLITQLNDLVTSSTLIGGVNNAQVTISGVNYPVNHLRYAGFDADYQSALANDNNNTITLKFEFRKYSSGVNNYGWEDPTYERIAAAPYWQPAYVMRLPPIAFPSPL